jgi:hypothetical protein
MLPSTLEWLLVTLGLAITGFHWPFLWIAPAVMLLCSLLVAVMQARQACLAPTHEGLPSRLLLTGLCYVQPLVRSWSRYQTRFTSIRPPVTIPGSESPGPSNRLSLAGRRSADYWSEEGCKRIDFLRSAIQYLNQHHWGKTIDSGWQEWDLEVHCDAWTVMQVCTVQEDHGADKRLIRVKYRLRTSGYTRLLACGAAVAAPIAGIFQFWPAALAAGLFIAAGAGVWLRGVYRARRAVSVFDIVARELNLVRCDVDGASRGTGP